MIVGVCDMSGRSGGRFPVPELALKNDEGMCVLFASDTWGCAT